MSILQQMLAARIDQALGREPADLVVKNARLLNTATGRLEGPMDIAIAGDVVIGTHGVYEGQREIDAGPGGGTRLRRLPRPRRKLDGGAGRVRARRAALRHDDGGL